MTDPVFQLTRPAPADALPIVLDSPHSGTEYPADFGSVLDAAVRHYAEDCFVDRLYAGAPRLGATLLAARFARLYIDPNRSVDDLDEQMFDEPWPVPLAPSQATRLGIGLIWRLCDGRPVYDRRLTIEEVRLRIERYWRPYHDALWAELDATHRRFGALWHLNVHAMTDDSYRLLGLPDSPLADFVLGDLDGTTADEATLATLEGALRSHGFSVARNDPFKGQEIIRRSGRPAEGRRALLIEVKMSCYMDTARHRLHDGFPRVTAALDAMLQALAEHVRRQL
ncbi:MAG TPA: N-formylglutamate amidohydrolase [Kofleriaceae bacterium]|jgi:N-formylglutamate deformylase|nr:N-formylglutamate amidohydrolase [Kofleriaceae bacterium]